MYPNNREMVRYVFAMVGEKGRDFRDNAGALKKIFARGFAIKTGATYNIDPFRGVMVQQVNTSVRVPFVNWVVEITPLHKKVAAVAIGTLLLLGVQLGFSLAVTMACTCLFMVLTALSEKYLRSGGDDWLNLNFSKKEVAFISAFLVLRPFLIQIVCWALGIPIPILPQTGIAELVLSRPWRVIPLATVVAPIAEEIFFRGFLLERFEDAMVLLSRWKVIQLSKESQKEIANVCQAVIFGAVHLRQKIEDGFKFPVFLGLSLAGYIFGKMKRQEKGLIPPMIVHSANNSGAVIQILLSAQ